MSATLHPAANEAQAGTTAGDRAPGGNTNGERTVTASGPPARPHEDAPRLRAATITRLTAAGTSALAPQDEALDSRATGLLDPELWESGAVALPTGDRGRFVRKQEWVGRVEEVRAETFVARLRDVTDAARDDDLVEEAELYLEEVSPGDRSRVRPGAVFYWVIGYHDLPTGQRLSRSQLIFRHTQPLTEAERSAAITRAEDRWQRLTQPQAEGPARQS